VLGKSPKAFVEPYSGAAYNAVMVLSQSPEIPPEWLAEFEAAARRPLALRMKYAFIKTYKPVMDDAPFRAFDTTAQYREWCEANLPDWLGYGRL
jgi:hypothetical protein